MRTQNLFNRLAAIVIAASLTVGAFAQLTTTKPYNSTDTTTVGETTKYYTVGSRIPFATNSTSPIHQLIAQGILIGSAWKWEITNGPGGTTFYAADGSSALTDVTTWGTEDLTGQGYVEDSIISIDFQNTGTLDLWVTERTVSNISGIAGCDGNLEHLPVEIVIAPTIVFNDADRIMGGCGADVAANNDIPITVSGNGYFSLTGGLQINYQIDYTDLTGSTSTILPSTIINDNDEFNTGWAQYSVNQGPTNTVIPFNITDGNYGTYTVTLLGITDEISRKSLDAVVGYEAAGLPVPAQRTLKIYALPQPTTQPIKHIQNIGW